MIAFITESEAKAHLRITGTRFDTDLSLKVAAANAAITNYLQIDETGSPIETPWGDVHDDIPYDVRAATMIALGDLWAFHEGNLSLNGNREFDPISPAVISLLKPYRDPSMA